MARRISDQDLERLEARLRDYLRTPSRVNLSVDCVYALVAELTARRDEEFRQQICETADRLAEEAVPLRRRLERKELKRGELP